MRLDKYLTELDVGSRSRVKEYIKKGLVTINGTVCKNPETKINENSDIVCYLNQPLVYSRFQYFMLNKPQGVITATKDNCDKTVMDLLHGERRKDLFPVGRLDKDTEGLLLITNDGELAHALLSPKKHVDKSYLVNCRREVSRDDIEKLEKGVDIGDASPTLPAKIKFINSYEIILTIHEGRYHQVKRMLQAVNNEVVFLKRISFGSLTLDAELKNGEYRALTHEEISLLRKEL